jgi:hypothetical protein
LKHYGYPLPSKDFLIDSAQAARTDAQRLVTAIGARARLLLPPLQPGPPPPHRSGGAAAAAAAAAGSMLATTAEEAAYHRNFVQAVLLQQFIVHAFHDGPRRGLMRLLVPLPVAPHARFTPAVVVLCVLLAAAAVVAWLCVLASASIGPRAHACLVLLCVCTVAMDACVLQVGAVFVTHVLAPAFVVEDNVILLRALQGRFRLILRRTHGAMQSACGLVHHFNAACRVARVPGIVGLTTARLLASLNDFELRPVAAHRNAYTSSAGSMNIFLFSVLYTVSFTTSQPNQVALVSDQNLPVLVNTDTDT